MWNSHTFCFRILACDSTISTAHSQACMPFTGRITITSAFGNLSVPRLIKSSVFSLFNMSIHRTRSPSPPPAKKHKIDHSAENEDVPEKHYALARKQEISCAPTMIHSVNYRDGIMLAPMVRSGTRKSSTSIISTFFC